MGLGKQAKGLSKGQVEAVLSYLAFILQAYYVQQWADNCVIHMRVSDVKHWVGSHRWPRPRLSLRRQNTSTTNGGWGFGGRRDRSLRSALADRRGARAAWHVGSSLKTQK
jgi:hypothetical protein